MNQDDLDKIDEYLAFLSRRFSKLKFKRNPYVLKSVPSYKKDSEQNKSFVDISNLNVTTVGLLGTSLMSAESQRLRKEEMVEKTLATERNTLIFSDPRKRLLFQKRKIRLQQERTLMRKNLSTLP